MGLMVKKFLKRVRMTQYDLAEKLGCNQSLVAVWCTGKGVPTYDKICKLIDLGMTAEELFGTELAEKLIFDKDKPIFLPTEFNKPDLQQAVLETILDLKAQGKI